MRLLRRISFRRILLLVVLGAASSVAATAHACPGCKEATSAQGNNLARGFSYSILFMMPLPFIILGSFGGYVYYTVKQRERSQADSAGQTSATPLPERNDS